MPLPQGEGSFQYRKWLFWIQLFIMNCDAQYNLRYLPEDGGLFDQDWLYMEIFAIIRDEYIKGSKNG